MARTRPIYHDLPTAKERRAAERRVASDPTYRDAERRKADRRAPPRERDKIHWMVWLLFALVAFAIIDSWAWDGYYRRALSAKIDETSASTRAWSDRLWG